MNEFVAALHRRTDAMRRLRWLSIVIVGLGSLANAQTDFTRVYGPLDKALPVPRDLPATGEKDANALQELLNFITAVDPGEWKGMQGSGTISFEDGSTAAQAPAVLTILNGDAFRLDVGAATGQRSIRINGTYGAVLEDDGKEHLLPPATARDGILAFPSLFVQAFAASPVSVLDGGMIMIDGKNLHRMTVVRPVFSGAPAAWMSTVDLYFDPTTAMAFRRFRSTMLSGGRHLTRFATTVPSRDVLAGRSCMGRSSAIRGHTSPM